MCILLNCININWSASFCAQLDTDKKLEQSTNFIDCSKTEYAIFHTCMCNKTCIQKYYLLRSFLKFKHHYMFVVNKCYIHKSLWNELWDCIPTFECSQSTASRCTAKITDCICTPFYRSNISTKNQNANIEFSRSLITAHCKFLSVLSSSTLMCLFLMLIWRPLIKKFATVLF